MCDSDQPADWEPIHSVPNLRARYFSRRIALSLPVDGNHYIGRTRQEYNGVHGIDMEFNYAAKFFLRMHPTFHAFMPRLCRTGPAG
jgi:hypothetical protein